MRTLPNKSRGYALIMVLGVLVLLTTMAMAFAGHVRQETRSALSLTERVRLGAAADAAVAHALHRLTSGDRADIATRLNEPYELPWPDTRLRISLHAEAGLVDINLAPRPLLIGLFQQLLPDMDAASLADAVLDWRDRDDRRSPQGAEAADYRAAGLAYTPANRRFVSTDELGRVLGMTHERLQRLHPYITVHSRRARIDPYSAAIPVLAAVPGIDVATAERFVAYRTAQQASGTPVRLDMLQTGMRHLERRPTLTTVNIRVQADNAQGRSLVRSAVYRVKGKTHQLLAWQHTVMETD